MVYDGGLRMVSWDLEVRFAGLSPNVEELRRLAKQEGFSNIESIEYIKADIKADKTIGSVYRLVVNDRGYQTKFKFEKVDTNVGNATDKLLFVVSVN